MLRVAGQQHIMADSFQDSFDGTAIQLFVVDDEHVILLQDGLRMAEGAARA